MWLDRRRFLAAAPTFPEMGVLYRLLDLVRAKRRDGTDEHEMIIVDLPATGHALALAQIPASLLRVIPSGPIAAAVREAVKHVVAKQIDERTDLKNSKIGPVQKEAILAAGVALQKAGVIKSEVNVKATVDALLDSSFH